MAPKTTIYCVRHAQGFHNLNTANHSIRDPLLTELGKEQCAALNSSFPHHSRITHLVASPLRRTIYTTLLSFPSEVQRGLKITTLPELQETSDFPCDTGSDREVLEKEFGDNVDLERAVEGWHNKLDPKWSASASAIEARAQEARLFLRQLAADAHAANGTEEKEVHIVVVTHGGFLHYFTEDWVGADKFVGTGWTNTEWRSYEFVEGSEAASLRELSETAESRGVHPLSEAEQRNLKNVAEADWESHGWQTPRNQEPQEPLKTAIEVSA